jgi:hypothetical protein
MDILNWLYLAKNKFVRTTPSSDKDLMVFGAKVGFNKRGDLYQNYAMSIEDFAANIGGGGIDIETITVDMNLAQLGITPNGTSSINYVFAGFNTFADSKSSIISLSDGSYLVGPVQNSEVPA